MAERLVAKAQDANVWWIRIVGEMNIFAQTIAVTTSTVMWSADAVRLHAGRRTRRVRNARAPACALARNAFRMGTRS